MKRFVEVFLAALAVVGAAAAVVQKPAPAGPATEAGTTEGSSRPPAAEAAGLMTPSAETGGQEAASATPAAGLATVHGLAGLKDLGKAVSARLKKHGTVMLAAGLSYYALLATFPAAIAAVSIWGYGADPVELERQVADLTSALPDTTAKFVTDEVVGIVDTPEGALGVTAVVSILAALWSASAATKALITGINYAYGQPETRSFLALRLAALMVTIGGIVFGLGALLSVGFLPQILSAVGLEDQTVDIVNVIRWPIVLLLVILGLGALYKLAPNRPWRMTRWVSIGALTATGLWILVTLGLSFYVNNYGASFGSTYGALAGLIVLMLWYFISGVVVLLGAELNSELEHRGAY